MGLEVVLGDQSSHPQKRITERMGITSERVKEILSLGLYAEVASIEVPYKCKYIVIWDNKKKKPFLLILKNSDDVWSLTTVYETFAGHTRRDWVVIKYPHIHEAMRKYKEYHAGREAAAVQAARAKVFIDLIIRYQSPDTKFRSRRHPVGHVNHGEYEKRHRSNHRQLIKELLDTTEGLDFEIPNNASISYELYQKTDDGKVVLVSEEL